jgi:hypothetical protein
MEKFLMFFMESLIMAEFRVSVKSPCRLCSGIASSSPAPRKPANPVSPASGGPPFHHGGLGAMSLAPPSGRPRDGHNGGAAELTFMGYGGMF